jgi:hypothetical protein
VFNGQGTAKFANGDMYRGEFRDGKYNGPGTYIYANGTQQKGQFNAGQYIGPSNGVGPGASLSLEVHLEQRDGVLVVPVLINNKIVLDFIIDSGASDVSVPADDRALFKTKGCSQQRGSVRLRVGIDDLHSVRRAPAAC